VEPFVVGHGASHVVVVDAVVGVGVASDGGSVTARDDDDSVGVVAVAGVLVVDENITREDVGRRSLLVAAGASPAVSASKAVTKVLGADLLSAARIATA